MAKANHIPIAAIEVLEFYIFHKLPNASRAAETLLNDSLEKSYDFWNRIDSTFSDVGTFVHDVLSPLDFKGVSETREILIDADKRIKEIKKAAKELAKSLKALSQKSNQFPSGICLPDELFFSDKLFAAQILSDECKQSFFVWCSDPKSGYRMWSPNRTWGLINELANIPEIIRPSDIEEYKGRQDGWAECARSTRKTLRERSGNIKSKGGDNPKYYPLEQADWLYLFNSVYDPSNEVNDPQKAINKAFK